MVSYVNTAFVFSNTPTFTGLSQRAYCSRDELHSTLSIKPKSSRFEEFVYQDYQS